MVTTTIVAVLLLNTPDAPDPGAVNVTFTPGTGVFEASSTVTPSAVPKDCVTCADCGVAPVLADICVGVSIIGGLVV